MYSAPSRRTPLQRRKEQRRRLMWLLKSLGIHTPRNPHYQVLAIPVCLSPQVSHLTKYLADHDFCSNTLHTTTTIEFIILENVIWQYLTLESLDSSLEFNSIKNLKGNDIIDHLQHVCSDGNLPHEDENRVPNSARTSPGNSHSSVPNRTHAPYVSMCSDT
jgi:hypothetical protein